MRDLNLKVRVKKLHENAVVPVYSKPGDAGLDLTATRKSIDEFGNIVYGTGLAVEVPEGHVALLFPRSSNSKKDLKLTNSVGVVDSGYRGEIMFKYRNDNWSKLSNIEKVAIKIHYDNLPFHEKEYQVGDRIGQMIIMPYPQVELIESEELSETERGAGGYGSTGA